MKHAYVTALVEKILSGMPVGEALDRTKATLEKHGHSRLWSQVLKAAARLLEAKLKSHVPQVTIAQEGGVSEAAIESALAKIGAKPGEYRLTVDPTLIGGMTARFKGMVLDQSYKRALVDLYRRITK
jgi:F0F1-type ATP synthase delta subunit